MAVRTRTVERDGTDDGDDGCDDALDAATSTVVEYGIGAWADRAACEQVLDAIRADATALDADATRVWLPETARSLSDVAAAGAPLADDAMVVLAADLTGRE